MESGLLANELPGSLALTIPIEQPLRYGENPQDRAAFYLARETQLPEQLGGKALSYNNLLDLDATLRMLVRANVGIAHPAGRRERRIAARRSSSTPCRAASPNAPPSPKRCAPRSTPIRSRPTAGSSRSMARSIWRRPKRWASSSSRSWPRRRSNDDALARLQRKKNLRIMRYEAGMPQRIARELRVRSALGGVLAEDDDPAASAETWQVVSRRAPDAGEWRDLIFAWDVVRHVKSNGVAVVRDAVSRGICAGQTNRVSAVRIAGERAGSFARGAACASDGFFPFADGLIAAADAGCSAVIAPSGSIRDAEVIAAADARGIALVFSNYRYFLH